MKLSIAFLAGAALIAGAVIWAGGKPSGWFVGGLFTSAVMLGTSVVAIGIGRTGNFLVALGEALSSDRAATPGPRKTKTLPRKVVQFPNSEMLRTTQQQVVSALVNQGMSMQRAEKAVLEVSEDRPGLDFDTLFRLCVAPATRAGCPRA